MRRREQILKLLRSPAFVQFVCMAVGGGVSILASNRWDRPFYVEIPVREIQQKEVENGVVLEAAAVGRGFLEERERAKSIEALVREADGDGIGKKTGGAVMNADFSTRLNFAFYYDEGTAGDRSRSYAAKAYEALLKKDASWISAIYGLRRVSPDDMAVRLGRDKSSVTGTLHLNGVPLEGEENVQVIPSWNRFHVTFYDGDGNIIMGHSNIKEILSVANVYAYFNDEQSWDFLMSSTESLWDSSHSYSVSVSDVYYCQGECQYAGGEDEDDQGPEGGVQAQTEDWRQAEAVQADAVSPAAGDLTQSEENKESGGTGLTQKTGQEALEEPAASGEDLSGTSPESSWAGRDQGAMPEENRQSLPEASWVDQGQGEMSQEAGQSSPQEEIPPLAEDGQSFLESSPDAQASGDPSQAAGQTFQEPIPASQIREETSQEGVQDFQEPDPLAQSENPPQESGTLPLEAPLSQGGSQGADESPQYGTEPEADQGFGGGDSKTGSQYCRGHVDLNVSAVILGMDGKKNLFTQIAALAPREGLDNWKGWDDAAMDCARTIAGQDWYEEYGLTSQDAVVVYNPLSASEVESYISLLPAGTSQKRQEVVRQALLSIGCIPYYWGGKPSGGGFEKNGFGTVTSPDEDGRILKGLDCSGWINWVYWTAFDSPLPAESTSGLMSCGRAVEKKGLKAGDILIRAGSQPHVYLFLAWAQDGSMYLIHETTGNVNNVTIGTYDLDLPYYRCLIDEE